MIHNNAKRREVPFMKTKSTVAIVGRPNVGKSTIFNRIAGERISIVEDTPGVTRDRIYAEAEWVTTKFNIIDTGGIEIGDEPMLMQIRHQAEIAIEEADVIMFVVDGREGITTTDQEVANILYRSNKPVVLAVNKIDTVELRENIFEYYSLGFGDPFPVSGAHGIGVGDVLDEVLKHFPTISESEIDEDIIYFSVIGRPNVGKSSLVNAILNEERVIVSEQAGTTRDAIDTNFTRDEQKFIIIDTAGMRKRGRVYEATEKYSVLRALKAIDRSDVCLIVLDAETGIQEQDKRVAGYAHEAGKGVIIVVNKWDTVDSKKQTMDDFEADIRLHFQFLDYAPIVFLSAKTKRRLHTLLPMIKLVSESYSKRIATNVLNDVFMDAIALHPAPAHKGKRLKLYYSTQIAIKPPSFAVFLNDPDLMHFTYKRFLQNKIRESFGFIGTPLNIYTRKRQ